MAKLGLSGVVEVRENADEVDLLAEEVREIGHTTLYEVLDPAQLEEARQRIDAIYERQVEEIGGVDKLDLIEETDVARSLVSYDDFFVEVAANARVRALVERLLGTDYFVLMAQNGIINRPTEEMHQLKWHRDLQYRHFTSSRPLAISALYCIDDFSPETGGTHLLPVSHRSESFPSEEYVERHEIIADVPAGSVLIFDSMMFHRAGANRSDRIRRGVNHIYTLPMIQQQISLPSALGGRHSDDPRLRRLLGYESPPAANALEWRTQRVERARAAARGNGSSTG
jgi:ectoine hydroxylase-related dioxygenase (phytanoyl-CoA dioxygenase family)